MYRESIDEGEVSRGALMDKDALKATNMLHIVHITGYGSIVIQTTRNLNGYYLYEVFFIQIQDISISQCLKMFLYIDNWDIFLYRCFCLVSIRTS